MAKPRIFISSTFYDLKQIRVELDKFIESLGYEPIRNEEGDIPYGKDEELQKYCYKEISNIDILVSIIGSRYGNSAISDEKGKEYSISQKEVKTAIDNNKQVFVFIDKNVLTEYETYALNKEVPNVNYKYVDNVNIYKFIEEIKSLTHNNNIKAFETAEDITNYLREQFAGLFKQFIIDSEKSAEHVVIQDMRDTAKVLHDLVDYLKEDNADKQEEINKIIRVNHPLVTKLKSELGIRYNFYIEGEQDLEELLKARRFARTDPFSFKWVHTTNDTETTIEISDSLFENGSLQYINPSNWKDSYLKVTRKTIPTLSSDLDDLPF